MLKPRSIFGFPGLFAHHFSRDQGKAAAHQLPRFFCLLSLKLGVTFAFFHFHFSGLSLSSLALLRTIKSSVTLTVATLSTRAHIPLVLTDLCMSDLFKCSWHDSLFLRSGSFVLEFHTGLRALDSLSKKAKAKKTLSISTFLHVLHHQIPYPIFLSLLFTEFFWLFFIFSSPDSAPGELYFS